MELIISNDMTITFILQQKDMDKKKKEEMERKCHGRCDL